jgi:hypothetical protein
MLTAAGSSGPGAQAFSRRRLGCLAASFVAMACGALVVTATVIGVRRYDAQPPPPPSTLSAAQLALMKPLDGIWQDNWGSELIFTDPGIVDGHPTGKVTFVNVPNLYSWQWDGVPSPSGQGNWAVTGRVGRGGGLLFWFEGPPFGEYGATVGFAVEGSVSNPILICQYPDGGHACTYTRQS